VNGANHSSSELASVPQYLLVSAMDSAYFSFEQLVYGGGGGGDEII
jgi:hypothetical protein